MVLTIETTNSKSSGMAAFTQQFVSAGDILNTTMGLTAYESGPVPSATSMAILAEQRGSSCAFSCTDIVPPCIKAQESHREKTCPAPTLRVIIPSSPSSYPAPVPAVTTPRISNASCPIPTIEIVPPTPTTPRSHIHLSCTKKPTAYYTLTSYYDLARRAPPTERVPYLPQFCLHSARPFIPPRTNGCALCALQLLACDTWFLWSSGSKGELRAPVVLPAKCTVKTRSVYYALRISLGEIDQSCVDHDIVQSIMIPRSTVAVCHSHKKPTVRGPSRIRKLFCRAAHALNVLLRAPVFAAPR